MFELVFTLFFHYKRISGNATGCLRFINIGDVIITALYALYLRSLQLISLPRTYGDLFFLRLIPLWFSLKLGGSSWSRSHDCLICRKKRNKYKPSWFYSHTQKNAFADDILFDDANQSCDPLALFGFDKWRIPVSWSGS